MKNYSKYLNGKSQVVEELLEKLFVILDEITNKDYKVEEKQTSLHLVKEKAFLGVHFLKDKLRINIVLKHPITHQNLYKSEQVSKNRFHNKIDFYYLQDLDSKITKLIKEAYEQK